MEAHEVKQFVKRYFTANQCQVDATIEGLLEVQLTEEMDKKIMNRPFYWHYMNATDKKGVPQTLLFQFQEEPHERETEKIHFGSYRFQQIMEDLTNKQPIVRAYEDVDVRMETPLYPWLVMNVKLSYVGMQTKDEIFSLGLHLITGKIVVHMMEKLQKLRMQSHVSPLCYLLSPMITYASGCKRIERILDVYLEEQQHDWAIHSMHALQEELQLIQAFYEEDTEEKNKEFDMIQKRYQPEIICNVFSGGIVYLTKEFNA